MVFTPTFFSALFFTMLYTPNNPAIISTIIKILDMINFFASTIYIDIIVNDSFIKVVNDKEVLTEGAHESCMDKIRQIVNNIPGKEEKTFVFNIINKASSLTVFEVDRSYFRSQLFLLNSSCGSNIKINEEPYNRLA